MILVKLQGGLGNQLFQCAFGLSASSRLNTRLYFDGDFFNDKNVHTPRPFELNNIKFDPVFAEEGLKDRFLAPGITQKILNKTGIHRLSVYREQSLRFDDDLPVRDNTYYDGYWQSERYFAGMQDQIRKAFSFKGSLNKLSEQLAATLAGQTNSISMHVRRGDYVSSGSANEVHGLCSVAYYQKAIECIRQKIASPIFYFFSDDTEWVRENLLPAVENGVLVDHNQGQDSWQDMLLMSKCKHHIIANSSFSWWGAWLNPHHDKIVIAPQQWFKTETQYFDSRDIILPNWIQLPNE